MTTAILEPAATQAARFRVGELKDGAFAAVKAHFKNHKDAIDILNFLDFLAQNNSVSADDLELPITKGVELEWNLDRASVTKLFFSHLEEREAAGKAKAVLPNEAAQKELIKAMNQRAQNFVAQVEREVADLRARATVRMNEAMFLLSSAFTKREELNAIRGKDTSWRITSLMEGLPATNWDFMRSSGALIYFVSRTDVILRHIDKTAGLHYELNCGKFMLRFDLTNMSVKMFCHERNAPSHEGETNLHPHISTSGTVCWGNASDAVGIAMTNGDILKILQIIDNMLPHYNPSSPYITIEDFKTALGRRDKREREKHAQKEKQKEAAATAAPGGNAEDIDILDDEPDFVDDIGWDNDADEERDDE